MRRICHFIVDCSSLTAATLGTAHCVSIQWARVLPRKGCAPRPNAYRRLSQSQFILALLAIVCVTLSACAPPRGTVGARFGRDRDGHLYVRDIPAGLGAARAGLKEGDEVILIEGRDVRGYTDTQLHEVLSGERGSKVRLTLLRGDQVIHATVERTPPTRSIAAEQGIK